MPKKKRRRDVYIPSTFSKFVPEVLKITVLDCWLETKVKKMLKNIDVKINHHHINYIFLSFTTEMIINDAYFSELPVDTEQEFLVQVMFDDSLHSLQELSFEKKQNYVNYSEICTEHALRFGLKL